MNIVAWAVIFPLGILFSGFLSSIKPFWLGILPTILYSALFLGFHWSKSTNLLIVSDMFLLLALVSVLLYGICRLIVYLITRKRQDKKKSDIDKSKVQDL